MEGSNPQDSIDYVAAGYKIARYIAGSTPDRDPAIDLEDLGQEASIMLWKYRDRPRQYQFASAKYAIFEHLRKLRLYSKPKPGKPKTKSREDLFNKMGLDQRLKDVPDSEPPISQPDIDDWIASKAALLSVLHILTVEQARILFPVLQGYKTEDVAKVVGLSQTATNRRIHKIKEQLAREAQADPVLAPYMLDCVLCGGATYYHAQETKCIDCGHTTFSRDLTGYRDRV